MARLKDLTTIAQVAFIVSVFTILASITAVILVGIHTEWGSAVDVEHPSDVELEKFLDPDREISVLIANDDEDPIFFDGDLVINDLATWHDTLSGVNSVFTNLVVTNLITRRFEGAPGDFVDVVQLIENIRTQIDISPDVIDTLTALLEQAMMRYVNVQGNVNATCIDYTDLIVLETIQQTNLVTQNTEIQLLEAQVANLTAVNGTVFTQYDITILVDLYNILVTNTTNLESLVLDLRDDVIVLEETVSMFLNMSSNGTSILGMIVSETIILTGQVGTLFVDAGDLVTSCNATNTNATNLLTTVNTQLTLVNLTRLITINNTLIQIGEDITNVVNILNLITNETITHSVLLDQLRALNVSVNDCKNQIDSLLNMTLVFLDAANVTSSQIETSLVTTNTTIQTFVTTVNDFLNTTGFNLLSNLTAANSTLYTQYDLVLTNQLILVTNLTALETDLSLVFNRIATAQNNVTILSLLINTLDGDASTLLLNSTSLLSLIGPLVNDSQILLIEAQTLNANIVALNISYTVLQSDIFVANSTAFVHQSIVDDHEIRITALEAINATAPVNATLYDQFLIPSVTAGEAIAMGDVVSIDESGRAFKALGLREVESFQYAQIKNGTLSPGNILSFLRARSVNPGNDFEIDAQDNFYFSMNYRFNESISEFEGIQVPNNAFADFVAASDDIYTGVGDVFIAKFSYANEFAWVAFIDAALSVTVTSKTISPKSNTLWVSGYFLNAGTAFNFGAPNVFNSTSIFFINSDGSIAFEYTFTVDDLMFERDISISFFGELSQNGEWVQLFFFDFDSWNNGNYQLVSLQDVEIDGLDNLYGCGFFTTNSTGQNMTVFVANLDDGVSVIPIDTLSRDRPDLAVTSIFNTPTANVDDNMARVQGFYFSYNVGSDTLNFFRTDEGVDDVSTGDVQKPWRFMDVVIDQSNRAFLAGWDNVNSDVPTNSTNELGFKRNFTLSSGAQVSVGFTAEKQHGLIIMQLDRVTGDYTMIIGQEPLSPVPGFDLQFTTQVTGRKFFSPNSWEETYFDSHDGISISADHRGNLVFFGQTFTHPGGIAQMNFTSTRTNGEVSTSTITTGGVGASFMLVKFSGFGDCVLNVVTESVISDSVFSPDKAHLFIGPDSYIWTAHTSSRNSSLGGILLGTTYTQDYYYGDISPDQGVYFHKFDNDFSLIWGEVLIRTDSVIDTFSGFKVDRHRNIWYIQDRESFGLNTNVNLTVNPTFELIDTGFSVVRNVDMTHIPIGVAADSTLPGDPVRIVMQGLVPNATSLPTVAGRNYCNFHGVLQTSKCYSMPSMGFAPSNGTLMVDIHRDGLRYSTKSVN